jgi:hypothetical protein
VKNYSSTDEELLLLSIPFDAADSERAARFTELLGSRPDWNYLEKRLIDCRLSGFFLRNLSSANASHLAPDLMRERISSVIKKDLVDNLLYLETFKELADTLNKNNIDFIALKGMALYFTVYAKSRFRFMLDIDLLVKEAQYEEVKRVLGYEDLDRRSPELRSFDVYQEFMYIKNTEFKCAKVDIHRSLIKGVRRGYFNGGSIWRDSMLVATATQKVRILSPEMQVMHLCANLVKNIYTRQSYLISFCDVVETIKFYSEDLKWEHFLKLVEEEKVEREAYSVLSWLYKNDFIRPPEIMEEHLRPFFKRDILAEMNIPGFEEYSYGKFRWHLISNTPSPRRKMRMIYYYIFPSRQQLKVVYPHVGGPVVYFYYWMEILRKILKSIVFLLHKPF